MLDLGREMADPDVAGRVTCPTLLLISDGDRTVPSDTGARLARSLGGPVEMESYARSDHVLFRDFDREDATARTVEFLTAGGRQEKGGPEGTPRTDGHPRRDEDE